MQVESSQSVLDRYRVSLTGIKTLDPAEERELTRAWRQGNAKAGEKLVESSLPFVIRIAHEYRRWGIPLEDLIQQGNIGLLRAAAKYDTDKNCRLVTYAVYWIRAEIRDYVVKAYRIVRLGTTRTERKAMRTYRRTGAESAEALAELSGMPLARCEKLWPLLAQGDMSLDATYDDSPRFADKLVSEACNPEEETMRKFDQKDVREVLDRAMSTLSLRERRIIEERMIADEPKTLEALGHEMGVSKERVRQIEERVKHKLRDVLEDYQPQAA